MRVVVWLLIALALSACAKQVTPPDLTPAELVDREPIPDPYTRALPTVQEPTLSVPEAKPFASTQPRKDAPFTNLEEADPDVGATPPPVISDEQQAEDSPPTPRLKPAAVIEKGNAAARVTPCLKNYVNGEQRYPFEVGKLYKIYTAEGRVTTLILEPGEVISGNGFHAGDTQNWKFEPNGMIGDGPDERPIVVIMPYLSGLRTNVSLATNRRLYLMELRSYTRTYMPAVSWQYPQRDHQARLAQLREQHAHRRMMRAPRVNPEDIRTPYRIRARKGTPGWMPTEALHDGRRTYIVFPPHVVTAPALFVQGNTELEIVQYRVRENRDGGMTYIVDQVLHKAELRLVDGVTGTGKGERVLIEIDASGKGKK